MTETAERTKPAPKLDTLQVAPDHGPPLATIPPQGRAPSPATSATAAVEPSVAFGLDPAALLTIAREHRLSFAVVMQAATAVIAAARAALRNPPASRSAAQVEGVITARDAAREARRAEREALRQEREARRGEQAEANKLGDCPMLKTCIALGLPLEECIYRRRR